MCVHVCMEAREHLKGIRPHLPPSESWDETGSLTGILLSWSPRGGDTDYTAMPGSQGAGDADWPSMS